MKQDNKKTMPIQISSGQGPIECQLAVVKLLKTLKKECGDVDILSWQAGEKKDLLSSVQLILPSSVDCIGTVQWVCKSPYRKNHLRKNWYIGVQLIDEVDTISFDKEHVRFETFRSSGKGGQHVNTTDSAVRAIHIPTGIAVISQDERSQFQNKAIALERLKKALETRNSQNAHVQIGKQRQQHFELERGNPIRIYQGLQFKRIL